MNEAGGCQLNRNKVGVITISVRRFEKTRSILQGSDFFTSPKRDRGFTYSFAKTNIKKKLPKAQNLGTPNWTKCLYKLEIKQYVPRNPTSQCLKKYLKSKKSAKSILDGYSKCLGISVFNSDYCFDFLTLYNQTETP